jgi:hypothetical protein
MDNRLGAAKHPMIGVRALNPDAGLVRCDDRSPAQCRHRLCPALGKAPPGPLQQVHQPALAERETEEVGQCGLQPFVGQGLEGLQIGGHGVQPRPERRPLCGIRHGGGGPLAAGGAAHRQAPMLGDMGRYLREIDLLVDADRLPRQIRHQDSRTARAPIRTMLDHLIGRGADDPAVAFMSRLGTARLGLIPTLLAIRRGRL